MGKNRQSLLLTDTECRGNIEAMMDYCLAWTFKMCDKNNHRDKVNNKLLSECQNILSKLIGFDVSKESFSISTYLEWRKIDLVVEIFFDNGVNHVLLIENKVNSESLGDKETVRLVFRQVSPEIQDSPASLPGAEALSGEGDFLLCKGRRTKRIQGPMVTSEECGKIADYLLASN